MEWEKFDSLRIEEALHSRHDGNTENENQNEKEIRVSHGRKMSARFRQPGHRSRSANDVY